jgi:hypothetical protein
LNTTLSAHKITSTRLTQDAAVVTLDIFRSGYAILQDELIEEKASALGRLGRRLEAALAALAACPKTADCDQEIRKELVKQAGYALWMFAVQRESCGLRDTTRMMRQYNVPKEILAHMGPILPSKVIRSGHTR